MKMGLRWFFIKKTFPFWQKLGIHITPNHYYEPIPDTRCLGSHIWDRETKMMGVNINKEQQLEFLDNVCSRYKKEYDDFGLHEPKNNCQYYVYNGWFGEIDGDILYCILRQYKPRTVVEIGCGYSTLLSSFALNKNEEDYGIPANLISIDPYPDPSIKAKFPKNLKLIETRVQNIDLNFFGKLKENDILFVDSSHVVKIDSDVCYEYLEILPRLNKGVLIHLHDIFLPKEYPKDWVLNKKFFWNEEYLLQAFLMFNDAFEVIWAGNYMKLAHPQKCKEMFRSDASQSFWIKKIK